MTKRVILSKDGNQQQEMAADGGPLVEARRVVRVKRRTQ